MHHLLAFRSLVALELSLYISTSLHFLLLNCITYSHSLTANHAHSHSRQQEKTFTAACPWPAVGCNSSCGPSLSSMSWQCVPMHLWVCPTCTYPPVSSEVPPSKLSLPPSRLKQDLLWLLVWKVNSFLRSLSVICQHSDPYKREYLKKAWVWWMFHTMMTSTYCSAC